LEIPDFSFDKAMPKFAAAIEAQIDCDDTGDDFIKEKLHSNIRSSSTDSMSARHAHHPRPHPEARAQRASKGEAAALRLASFEGRFAATSG
jgi:hypothetical protein